MHSNLLLSENMGYVYPCLHSTTSVRVFALSFVITYIVRCKKPTVRVFFPLVIKCYLQVKKQELEEEVLKFLRFSGFSQWTYMRTGLCYLC